MTGRPIKRTKAIEAEIVERLSKGTPLATMCREDHLPAASTVYDWMAKDEKLSGAIADARAKGFDAIAAECLEIADEGKNDWMERNGVQVVDQEAVGRSKLRVETRLKLLAKWDPKRYGDMVKLADNEGGKLGIGQLVLASMSVGDAS